MKLHIKILWIFVIVGQFGAMSDSSVLGLITLMLPWILLYGLPLYWSMKIKQMEFELRQQLMFRDDMVSKMWAFLTSKPDKDGRDNRTKNYVERTVKEKLQIIKENLQ